MLMIEEVIFGNIQMPGELIRLVIAFAGVAVATYFDLFNNKNIPNYFLYGFLAVAFIANLFFYQENLFIFSILVAAFLSAVGYVFYRLGQIGGADLFVLASVMLLLPIQPSFVDMPIGMPFIFPVLIFGGVLFALYIMISFGMKLMGKEDRHPKWLFLLLAVPYIIFSYVYVTSILFSWMYFVILTLLFMAIIFFLVFRDDLMNLLAERMKVTQLEEEDVLALELMDKELVKKYDLKRLATKKEIERMQELGVEEVMVYSQMPAFIPFILAGMALALLFGGSLLFL